MSPYVSRIRSLVGPQLLLLPAVTAVIRGDDGSQDILLARNQGSAMWSLVGGGVEPGEDPADALRREVYEELGVVLLVSNIIGAYGGTDLTTIYPNGDEVSYLTVAYNCTVASNGFQIDGDELAEAAWFSPTEISELPRHSWIDRIIADAASNFGTTPGR